MDSFFKHWFGGFEQSLKIIDVNSRAAILKECCKACSNSYTKQIFIEARKNAVDEDAFVETLKKAFPELELDVIEPNRLYHIRYTCCACDLVMQGYMTSPYLCECSRSSLQYNWESLWGEGNVDVKLISSILEGASCCRFVVKRL